MSRLTDLIAQTKARDPKLGADLDQEFKVLSSRLPFGLNFERHRPEAVELPQRLVRKGDKVRVLPPRGATKNSDQRLWQVKAIHKSTKQADLVQLGVDSADMRRVALDDLLVVAEFSDTIFPGLVSTGKVQRGGDKPFHTVINGENYHVLQALTYTHRGKIDVIYIDPPYNTGAKDWKYNNSYVDGDDLYRHSKWLAMMERRLLIAQKLLNPADSVLIVTIDEKEYLRLGLLLEQTFPEATIQMVSSVINPKGASRGTGFRRTDEYLFFVMIGAASPARLQLGSDWSSSAVGATASEDDGDSAEETPEWTSMMRRGSHAARSERPGLFFPIYAALDGSRILEVGETVPIGSPLPADKPGMKTIWPLRSDGSEGVWQVGPTELRSRIEQGRVRLGRATSYGFVVNYLPDGAYAAVLSDRFEITGRAADGSLIARGRRDTRRIAPSQWKISAHNASEYGTSLLTALLPRRVFPFPKSLYAVEDALRFFVIEKPHATVLDFFSGSGTTAHAVIRLNHQDGGKRQCLSITNNEVAADEQAALRQQGLRPGDTGWEKLGICDYITKPRVAAAISGKTPDGEPIRGNYKFTDEFPMSEGFEANAEFFTLTYEYPVSVNHNLAFGRIAPLLWLRAGARGRRIDTLPADGWAVVNAYGLLTDVDVATPFIKAISTASGINVAYIVTDDDRRYQATARRLPDGVESVRLYESYLTNFSFTHGD